MSSSQKIGVLTFHRCINYGSYWQARCLVEDLRARGHDAELLDYHSRRADIAEWRCALRPTLPTPTLHEDKPRYRAKMRKFFCAFESLPLSSRFDLDNPAAMESYDTVVVGSDEVWNLNHPWYNGCALFFGDGIKAKRLVSYAASFGTYSAWNGLGADWAGRLRNFDAISVRDENSWWLLKNALDLEPPLVLDPCLQFRVQPTGEWNGPPEPFALIYGHNFSPEFIREVRRWAHERNCRLLSIGYRNDWADEQWLEAGPQDFAHAMARTQILATNFFHGCVFALRNQKPFVCQTSDYRSIKVQSLMETVGGQTHLVDEHTPSAHYDALLNNALAPQILANIETLRRSSTDYLDSALS